MRYKEFLMGVVVFYILFSSINLVNAIAVSGPYYGEQMLEISPGVIKDFNLIIQNMDGDSDIKYKVKIVNGSEFVEILEDSDEYLVPLGSNDIPVNLRVSIPEDTLFDEYLVRVAFAPISGGEGGGMIQIALGMSWDFKINVIEFVGDEQPAPTGRFSWIWIVLGILVVIVVIVVIKFFLKEKDLDTNINSGEGY